MYEKYNTVKFLLQFSNIFVNQKENMMITIWHADIRYFESPLTICCSKTKDVKIADLLLKHPDIDVNVGGIEGLTPAMLCCLLGKSEILKLLLKTSQKIKINHNYPYPLSSNPLVHACIKKEC